MLRRSQNIFAHDANALVLARSVASEAVQFSSAITNSHLPGVDDKRRVMAIVRDPEADGVGTARGGRLSEEMADSKSCNSALNLVPKVICEWLLENCWPRKFDAFVK